MANKKKPDPEGLFDAILTNWPIALVIASIIFSWAHFQNDLQSLQDKQTADEAQALVISADDSTINNNISSINAKLDIIIKHDNL